MSGGNTTTLDAIYKREYDTGSQVFTAQQNLKTYTWNKMKVSSLKPTPQGIFMPVGMSGNEAGGAINESESFQQAESYNPQQPQITSRLIYWPFQLTGTSIELSETNKQAFATSIDAQQKDNMSRMFSDQNRQSVGKGTGQMALAVGAGAVSTTLVVDNPYRFRRGMRLNSYVTVGGAQEITNALITNVNFQSSTLTLGSAQTWSNNSVIVKVAVLTGVLAGMPSKEMIGLQAICDTTQYSTNFENLPVSSNPEWIGNVVDGLGAPVSQDLLQKAAYLPMLIGGSDPKFLVSNYGQARVFLNSELQKTRYEPEVVKAGHTVLKWNSMEWLIEKDYDLGEVGIYDMDYVEKFQTRDTHLSQLTGTTLYQIVGTDQIGGYYAYYGNIGSWKRNAHARLTNLDEPTYF